MVLKQCPKCEQQVPVACKACPCGHIYFSARRPTGASKSIGDQPSSESELGVVNAVKRRRTERIQQRRSNDNERLARPSLPYKVHRSPRQHRASSSSTGPGVDSDIFIEDNSKRRRGRQKRNLSNDHEGSEKEEEACASISSEKVFAYSVVLAEINQKLSNSRFN